MSRENKGNRHREDISRFVAHPLQDWQRLQQWRRFFFFHPCRRTTRPNNAILFEQVLTSTSLAVSKTPIVEPAVWELFVLPRLFEG